MNRLAGPHLYRHWLVAVAIASTCAWLLALYAAPTSVQATPRQQSGVTLVKTVGVNTGECAVTAAIDITAGTPVHYCYTLTNNSGAAITAQTLLDMDAPGGQVIVDWSPGASAQVANGERLIALRAVPDSVTPSAIVTTTTGIAEWHYVTANAAYSVQSNSSTVRVVKPSIQVALTVGGTDTTGCSTNTSRSISLGVFKTAHYCVKVTNNSAVTFTNHVVSVPALNLNNHTFEYALGPQMAMTLFASNVVTYPWGTLPQLAQQPSQPVLTSIAYVASATAQGLAATGSSASVTVTVPAAVTVSKYVTTFSDRCPTTPPSGINAGTAIYYCLVVRSPDLNSPGSPNEFSPPFTYTHQAFSDSASGLATTLQELLKPGETITLTSKSLVNASNSSALGPFRFGATTSSSTYYTASNPAYNYSASAKADTTVNVTPPAATPVEPTPTYTPWPTSYFPATATWTPPPAPPTLPPILTPTNTPIPSPTLIVFSTPGAQTPGVYPPIGPGGIASGPPAGVPGQLDPNAAATATAMVAYGYIAPGTDPAVALAAAQSTANAATATAMVAYGYIAPGTDPTVALAAAQGTAQAATATAAAVAGYPAPGADPFAAATATTMVLNGYVAAGTDMNLALSFAQGTATAQALVYATPYMDPVLAGTATANALYGAGVPITDPGMAATATSLAASGYIAPGQSLEAAGATATTLAMNGVYLPGDPFAATATVDYLTSIAPPPTPPDVLTADAVATAATEAIAAPTSPLAPPADVAPGNAGDSSGPQVPAATPAAVPPEQAATQNAALGLFNRILESAGATLALIWLLLGSLIFFITAGVLAGLSFRRAERNRFSVIDGGEPTDFALSDPPLSKPPGDDSWPSSLP